MHNVPHRRHCLRRLAALALAAYGCQASFAAEPDYPSRPVKVVVPSTPGGSVDSVTRLLSARLSAKMNAPFVIENKPGANLQIASAFVAKSDPDGYTLLTTSPAHVANPLLYSKLPYDSVRDLTGVAMMVSVPLLMVVNADLPIHSVAELVAWGKAHPERLRYATSGSGSTANMVGELISMHTGVRLEHVPYKGAAPALPDLMQGRIDFMIDTLQLFAPHIRSGKLRAIGFTGAKRMPASPDIPTFAEQGYPDVIASSWLAVLAPAKTPQGVVDKLNRNIAEVLTEPAVRKQIAEYGMEPDTMSPAQLNRYFEAETARWSKVIKAGNIRIE